MQPPKDEKYVVLKRTDWEELRRGMESGYMWGPRDVEDFIVRDAVVIRRQDVFAPPALDAYANAITVALQVDEACTTEPNPRAQRLRNIADYFHAQATAAWETERKLPD